MTAQDVVGLGVNRIGTERRTRLKTHLLRIASHSTKILEAAMSGPNATILP
jgi:hypothetical protein